MGYSPSFPNWMPFYDDEEFEQLNSILERHFGWRVPEERYDEIAEKLSGRLRQNRVRRIADYCALLQYRFSSEAPALAMLFERSSTTFLAGGIQHEALLEEMGNGWPGHSGPVRVLVAGSGSGEEVYSLAFLAGERRWRLQLPPLWMEGMDLCHGQVARSLVGAYKEESLALVSPPERERLFICDDLHDFIVRDEFRAGIYFRQANILDHRSYGAPHRYDVVYCRDVLSHFGDVGRRHAFENFATALREGGYLILGENEKLTPSGDAFRTVERSGVRFFQRTETP